MPTPPPSFRDGPIEGVAFAPLQVHRDGRGWLAELFRVGAAPGRHLPAMAYVFVSLPGVVRGPHEHAGQTDFFAFPGIGAFRVWLWDNRPGSATARNRQILDVGPGTPATLKVPPGVVHALQCVSGEPGLVFNAPDRPYRGADGLEPVDEIRHEEDPGNGFSLDMGRGSSG